jgi:hypothetical protein
MTTAGPPHTTNHVSVVFAQESQEKKQDRTSLRNWNTLHRKVCSFKHHNATKDETVFLFFKFTLLLQSQNPQDGA